ncbi:hypothetical protein [Bacteroides sp.]|uniref:hypothetical protein n=1 Tax=Bacteroides sp. TaxID=29523 RepID=UPI00260FED40|nr:hypothetical protein [Bacteroides sp.]MDD3038841.1 hypothetical protein [Bacteroides sp.]
MTKEEQEKLDIVLKTEFSLNEADAISRVISDNESSEITMIHLLTLIHKNNIEDIENYDELIDKY